MVPAEYQELSAKQIPEATAPGVRVKVVAGKCLDVESPVFTRTPTLFLDAYLDAGATLVQPIEAGWNGFVYVLKGSGSIGASKKVPGSPFGCVRCERPI